MFSAPAVPTRSPQRLPGGNEVGNGLPAFGFSPLTLSMASLLLWIFLGFLGFGLPRLLSRTVPILYLLSACNGCLLAASGVFSIATGTTDSLELPWGLPGLPFHFRQDLLSSYFLVILGTVSAMVSIYSLGFFRKEPPRRFAWIALWTPFFLASMTGVLLSADAFVFLFFWEGMALASFFLVLTDVTHPWVRDAGFLYILMAHVGSTLILFSFILLALNAPLSGLGAFAFDMMGKSPMSKATVLAIFFTSLAGFGAKAGMIPLHIWLPEAHPAAPAPVSGLMSGVMLKIAIYGLIRMDFDFLGIHRLTSGMGAIILVFGALSALFGVLHALMQHEPKKLLAYHSIENVGIILIGYGLSIIFFSTGQVVPAALALSASLFHTLNHALFKSLLFLGAGAMVAATGAHKINDLGGLIHRMPYTATFFLVGSLSIAGLPPFNGFVSEWLTFQAALWATDLDGTFLRSLVVFSSALLALASALTAMCFVKLFGISFLGRARSPEAETAHESGRSQRLGMGMLAVSCVGAGLFPAPILAGIERVARSITGNAFTFPGLPDHWLWLDPISSRQAQYSPALMTALFAALFFLVAGGARVFLRSARTTSLPWNCGYPAKTPRMQDSTEAFGQPIRHFFAPLFTIERHLPDPMDPAPEYRVTISDPHWRFLYRPIVTFLISLSKQAERLRNRRISVYLAYSFMTLLLLLLLLR